jgi:Arc/MetJ-type ribon-helix-helix transcriptional regulator
MADLIRAKVGTGEYATESEVVRDAQRTLVARDRAVEPERPSRDDNWQTNWA